jgi:hypothetical protein
MKRILLLAGAALLSACSATKLVYNNLDWFASWRIEKFVELDGPSEALFTSGFETLWRWHRTSQLSLYASDLRQLADAAGSPLAREQVLSFIQRANDHGERLLNEALPAAVKVFQAMDDKQVAGLLKRMAEHREERAQDDAELDPAERRKRTAKNMHKNLKRWLGSVSPEQNAYVEAWVAARRSDPALWQRNDEQWAAAFADLLAARAQPDFDARLRGLLTDPGLPGSGAVRELQNHNQKVFVELISDLSGTLSPAQREHFQSELRALAQDLETLAAGRA